MNIAIIPARGGSKRIPQKNIKVFAGKPMIQHSIEYAIAANCFDQIIVSTDCPTIADVAKQAGASIPFMRPDALATDDTATMPVIKHALNTLNIKSSEDRVCVIYPTAPLLTPEAIRQGFDILCNSNKEYVFSAGRFSAPIQRAFFSDEDEGLSMFYPEHYGTRSQDLPDAFFDAGQFYWGRAQAFLAELPVFATHSTMVELPPWQVIDIDEPDDWLFAERLFHANQQFVADRDGGR